MGMLNAMNVGDMLNEIIYQIRPFEVNQGETDRVIRGVGQDADRTLRDRTFEIMERCAQLGQGLSARSTTSSCASGTPGARVYENLYGKEYLEALQAAATASTRWKWIACA